MSYAAQLGHYDVVARFLREKDVIVDDAVTRVEVRATPVMPDTLS